MTKVELSWASLVIAGWITIARAMNHDLVSCRECRGTGAQDPDCEICHGSRDVKLKRLYALGWKKGDLEDVDESDGYARCPSYDCNGDTCEFCQGDGRVAFHEQIQQERRALIFARYQRMPPLCTVSYWGRRQREHQLLSAEAAGDLVESGKATRLNVVAFGHEFYLGRGADFPALWREARERVREARQAHQVEVPS
jgi:hypothetical protein